MTENKIHEWKDLPGEICEDDGMLLMYLTDYPLWTDNEGYICVSDIYGCPECGEKKIDSLIWVADKNVECQNCKNVYRPSEKKG